MRNFYRCFSWLCTCSLLMVSAVLLSSCSLIKSPLDWQRCKRHTYINLVLTDYLKQRFHSQQMARMAIVPFDVPETFAPAFNDSRNYGRELARNFQAEMNKVGEVSIVELFDRDRWPGKRDDFFKGNYEAVEIARAAGYDFVLIGYLENIKNDSTLELDTKIIDTQNQVTVWSAKTEVESNARGLREDLSQVHLTKKQPELFDFPERTRELVRCTVDGIIEEDPVP